MDRERITSPAVDVSRILVVDDDLFSQRLTRGLLASEGYEIQVVGDAVSALRMLEERPPDLVLLDVVMPGMDGFETCRRLRLIPECIDTPVLFLTGLNEVTSQEEALASGGDDFLTKPIRKLELLMRVRSLLRVRQMRLELRLNYERIQHQHEALLLEQARKRALANLVVHDLKNPLAGILANAQFLARSARLAPDLDEAVGDILDSTLLMQRRIMNLIDLGKFESGAIAANRVPIDIVGLIYELEEQMGRTAGLRGQRFELRPLEGPAPVLGDPILLRRFFENLLEHAFQITPARGRVDLAFRRCDGGIGCVLRDGGTARDHAHVVRCLNPGHEGSEPDNIDFGLQFCQMVLGLHGGRVQVEPEETGTGAVFIHLPTGRGAV